MHVYKINIVLFFVLLSGTNIKTSEHILEIAKRVEESGWIDFNAMNTIDTSLKEIIDNSKENLDNQNFSLENVIDSFSEKITYVATNYPLHILVGCFISKKIYNYYKIFKEEIENERKMRLQEKLEKFLISKVPNYKEYLLKIDRVYNETKCNIDKAINDFPVDQIPSDIKELVEKLKHQEEIYPTKKPQFTNTMIEDSAVYMLKEDQAALHNWQAINVLLKITMRKKAADSVLKAW